MYSMTLFSRSKEWVVLNNLSQKDLFSLLSAGTPIPLSRSEDAGGRLKYTESVGHPARPAGGATVAGSAEGQRRNYQKDHLLCVPEEIRRLGETPRAGPVYAA